MWMTMVIAAAAFVTMVVMLALGYEQVEKERRGRSADPFATAPTALPGHCLLCNAPLPQQSTADEVVVEIEHRIDADLQAVMAFLARDGRTAPEHFARIYEA